MLEGAAAVIDIEHTAWEAPDGGAGAELLLSSGDRMCEADVVIRFGPRFSASAGATRGA